MDLKNQISKIVFLLLISLFIINNSYSQQSNKNNEPKYSQEQIEQERQKVDQERQQDEFVREQEK